MTQETKTEEKATRNENKIQERKNTKRNYTPRRRQTNSILKEKTEESRNDKTTKQVASKTNTNQRKRKTTKTSKT